MPRLRQGYHAGAILGLLALGCGAVATRPEPTGVVANPQFGEWQNMAYSPVQFVREVTFGAEDGGAGSLSRVVDLEADEEGNIYVYEWPGRLVSFSSDGHFRWESGQPGEGPGEFNDVRRIAASC